MKKFIYIIVPLLVVFILSCTTTKTPPPLYQDLSNRCSLADRIEIASFEHDLCGFVPSDSFTVLSLTDRVEGWSSALFEGQKSLEIRNPQCVQANCWQSVTKKFDKAIDLTDSPIIEYGILASEGPGRDFVTRLTLHGPNGKTFNAESHIIPTLWRAVVFDLHGCDFLNEISALTISLMNDSEQPWSNASWLIDGIAAGKPLDLDFNVEDSEKRFEVEGPGEITREDNALKFEFSVGASIKLVCDTSHNMICNPDLKQRNTIVITVENHSNATSLRLNFLTDSNKVFNQTNSKIATLPVQKDKQLVYFNLSDLPGACGHLRGLRLLPLGGNGYVLIDRIAFESENPIEENCGKINECTATNDKITLKGSIDPQYLTQTGTIEIRHQPHYKSELPFDSLELLAATPSVQSFVINDIPNQRLHGRMTHLSSRFCAGLRQEDGTLIKLGEPFFIENWREFAHNPYEFKIQEKNFYVTDYGAKGNGIDNDNESIQKAINAAEQQGGGNVILTGDTCADYGRQYLATNLLTKTGVNLVIETGAVLRQSPFYHHYTTYVPEYGHDNIIPGVPWTHCMYTNMPLILAKDVERVKITGGGEIRMDDTFSENPTWTHYARNCSDRIHIVPIAICNTKHVEISDININRCSNYHTIFYRADSVFIGNLKMQEVACLSGDGLSFGNAVTNVRIERCIFESNDDGIVLCSSYKDPRGGNWRERIDTIDSSVRNIEVYHSYIDCARGGGGKAIALIPWGSTNPRQDFNEIDNIEVRDCVLRGGNSVGVWADNPFDGKPFTNTEENDYAPVKNLRIFDNEYLSNCFLFGIEPTTLLTDCGLKGSSTFKNGDFADHLAYWTYEGKILSDPGIIKIKQGILYQGLHLKEGRYKLNLKANSLNKVLSFVTDALTKEQVNIYEDNAFEIDNEGTYLVGISAKEALVYSLTLEKIGK